jgi:hypothetical protein
MIYTARCASRLKALLIPLYYGLFVVSPSLLTASEATARAVVIFVIVLVPVASIAAEIAGEELARHCNA